MSRSRGIGMGIPFLSSRKSIPIKLKIDYTITQFVFKFKLPTTNSIRIYWGDGRSEKVTGQGSALITKTSAYSRVGAHSFFLTGDVNELTYIDISGQAFVSGDVSTWNQIRELIVAIFDGTTITGGKTVGAGKDYTTIAAAVAGVSAGDLISVEAATYDEYIDLSSKLVHIIGQGDQGVLMLYNPANNTYNTVNLGTDSSLRNMVINREYTYAGTHIEIIQVSACEPFFKYVTVGVTDTGNHYNANRPMKVDTAGIVTMEDCAIIATGGQFSTFSHYLTVADTSKLYFEGTVFRARLTLTDSSYANINTDYLDSSGNRASSGITIEDSAKAVINVRIKDRFIVDATDIEKTGGLLFSSQTFNVYTSGTLTLSGNEIQSGIWFFGDNCTINLNNITTTEGHFWVTTDTGMSSTPASQNSVLNMSNCDVVLDMDDDFGGMHLVEITRPIVVNIVDSTLEFSGHNGSWDTMGQCLQINGSKEAILTNSTFIDNCNDNIPFGANYEYCVAIPTTCTLTDCVFTNQNWDTVGNNNCLVLTSNSGDDDIAITLTRCTFNSDVGTATPINNSGNKVNATYTAGDYICVTDMVRNDGAAGPYSDADSGSNSATNWALLTGQCP